MNPQREKLNMIIALTIMCLVAFSIGTQSINQPGGGMCIALSAIMAILAVAVATLANPTEGAADHDA